MKKSLKLISLILAAIFIITGTMLVAFAEGEEVGGGEVSGGEVSGGEVGGGEVGGEVGGGEVGGGEVGGGEVGGGEVGGGEVGGGEVGGGEVGGEVGGGEVGGGEVGGYTDNSAQTYNYYNEDPIYYGDASNYDYNAYADSDNVAGSVSSNTTLYNTSGISAEEAAPNEWSEITLDEKTVRTGVADFSAIKTNTETTDNGQWILYLGYALIALSALGILYFIVATIVQSKRNKKAERMERRRSTTANHSAAARMEAQERRSSGARVSHFADESSPRSRRVSSKADTGEVYIPRRAAKKAR